MKGRLFSLYIVFSNALKKSNLYDIFERFRVMIECFFSHKIKSIQSDLGVEYKKLHFLFLHLGINHRQSCVYTHEQNDYVERRHKHIVDTGLTLMAHTSVPSRF